MRDVVITGIGMVTSLGRTPARVLDRITAGEVAAQDSPLGEAVACPTIARVTDFDAQQYYPENKMLRLMNRDAELAVVAAHLALTDARVTLGTDYAAHEMGLYGATGLSGMPIEDIARLVAHAAAADGSLDLEQFGQVALRRIRPVLSFKILANMPICFVSIFEGVRGPNSVYTPWEGQGAQAIATGIRAIRRGDVPCALAGGCDVKTHEIALITLQQLGVFDSWFEHGRGTVPGEGAAFLVLEEQSRAIQRSARIYARIRQVACRSTMPASLPDALTTLLTGLHVARPLGVVAAGDGDVAISGAERAAMEECRIEPVTVLHPKAHVGNTFAAAAAVQVSLAAECVARGRSPNMLANCFGFGTEQSCFLLEAV